ncbi:MAG TPA: S9 family peptidase [Anaerolineales bacterium]|nr:S9 family peptidase [Anaerolineales bacterium]
MPTFPIAPKRPYTITQHGETRIDNYYWLRDREDPAVLKFLQAHTDYLEESMGYTKPLQESLYAEMKGRIQETNSSVPEKRGGYLYYDRTEAGKQYPIFCRKEDVPNSPEEILLDQNELAEGKTFCSVSGFAVSPDEKKLAYSMDVDGNEVYTIYIKDLTNGSLFPEAIQNVYGSAYAYSGVEWANDNQTIFYVTLDEAQRSHQLHRHVIGTDPSQDVLIFEEEDETFSLYFHKTRDNKFIMTEHHSSVTVEVCYLSADQPNSELKMVSPRREGIEYYVDHHNGTFFIYTNDDAKNFKLVKTPVTASCHENWVEVIPHRPETMITQVELFENYLVLYERKEGRDHIRISDLDGVSSVRYVDFPEPTYYFEPGSNYEFNTKVLRFDYSSLVTPHSTIDYHMDTHEWELLKEDNVIGYDKSKYVCDFIYATAPDGTQIPISISYKKDIKLDGNNPTLLHGYGAYGSNLDVEFDSDRISLLDRGFVYAIGHIRGSSTLGREWYDGGKILKKKNSFNDFIACAEHLIREGFTSKDRLAIWGVSAGGLLVGACMTMRPDLYKAVIAKVPFIDVVTTMSDPTIPLTTLEYDEWGNPENQEHYEYMLSYSPYDNIRETDYPNLLLTGGFHDPRVMYWEPAKFAAKLREYKTDDNLLLLKINFHAGHAGSSGRFDGIKETAFEYAFLIDRLTQT